MAIPASSLPPKDASTESLLEALYRAAEKSDANPKPLVRHTLHIVSRQQGSAEAYKITSWKTAEFAYRKAESVGVGKDLPTLARGLFTVDVDSRDDRAGSSTITRAYHQRILVRGYDKFFNVGEMPWTKPAAIEKHSTPPYLLTFKENGCIIFIAALSSSQLIVTSKHALNSSRDVKQSHGVPVDRSAPEGEEESVSDSLAEAKNGDPPSHAAKGEEWLEVHLARVGRTKQHLASELWQRGETAVAELCDDTFEEHVLAYSPEKSGLHLHGLNLNSVEFKTRPMNEVQEFAKEWGFIPTRYLTLNSMQEVRDFTDHIGTTGEYEGEAIEGFVVRTAMPACAAAASSDTPNAPCPPYHAGQTWFYKVKFDEPYLMYRDWRELTKKMLTDKRKWDSAPGSELNTVLENDFGHTELEPISLVTSTGEPKSKGLIKKERKARQAAENRRQAQKANLVPLPSPPRPRSNRPETKLFIQWCYARIYGSQDGSVKPQMDLFDGISSGKGIIRLRNLFLAYLESEQGTEALAKLGGARGALKAKLGGTNTSSKVEAAGGDDRDSRPYTHLLIIPIAVPGCGKTSLFLALAHLFPARGLVGHTQSDDVTAKKTGPTFLKNICSKLSESKVVLADRNNHLLKHRDEIVEAVQAWEARDGKTEEEARAEIKRQKQQGSQGATATAPSASSTGALPMPKVKIVALAWSLDLLPLNTLHRLMSDRILLRGTNHQSLIADTKSASGSRSHETILWRFLETLETLGSAEGKGEGDKGRGDLAMDGVIRLDVTTSQAEQLKRLCTELRRIAPFGVSELYEPDDAQIEAALQVAAKHKVNVRKAEAGPPAEKQGESSSAKQPRYYGIAVEVDLARLVPQLLEPYHTGEVAATSSLDRQVIDRARSTWEQFAANERVISRPHITLVHSSALTRESASADEAQEREKAQRRWDKYRDLALLEKPVEFDIELGHLVWDDRVMAFSVQKVVPKGSALSPEEFWALQGGKGGPSEGRWRPHVTIGTANAEIRPFEANRVMKEAEMAAEKQGEQRGLVVPGGLGLIELGGSGNGRQVVQGRLMGMTA